MKDERMAAGRKVPERLSGKIKIDTIMDGKSEKFRKQAIGRLT